MSNFTYILFELTLLLISSGSLIAYHLIKERTELMDFSVKVPSKIEKNGNMFLLLFFILGVVFFCFFYSRDFFFKNNFFYHCMPMFGIYFLFGFLSFKNKCLIIFEYLFEFLVLFFTVGFLNLSIDLKIQMYLILGLFLVFKQPNVQKKYEIPVYCQMIATSLVMLVTSFLITSDVKMVLQLGGIVFSVMFVILPFQKIFQVPIRLNQYFINLFQAFFVVIYLYLISEGNIAASFVLLSYPLFEVCFAFFLVIYNFCKRQYAPCFMMDIFELMGLSDFDKGLFVLRRNLLFGAMFLFVMHIPSWQFQVVILTVILYLRFALSYVAGPISNASFRHLFKEMKNDIQKSVSEVGQALENIKQKKNQR